MADLVAGARHGGGALDGAAIGEARADDRVVRIALLAHGRGGVRARFRATTCASLIAYAEAACRALEAGVPAERLCAAAAVAALVSGVHPGHTDRAAIVAAAIRAAIAEEQHT